MSKQPYRIEGDFQMGRLRQHFDLQLIGRDEDDARDHLYSELGSRHGVPRRHVTITSVTAIEADQADPITKRRLIKGS